MIRLNDTQKAKEFLLKYRQLPMLYDIEDGDEDYAVYADNAEEISCVVIEYEPKNYYGVFSLEPKLLDEAYNRFFAEKHVWLGAADSRVFEYYKKYGFVCEEMCHMYEFTGTRQPNMDCPYAVTEIMPKDYRIVKERHQYRGTLKEIRKCAKKFPTSAIYIDGEMASWCMVHENLAMGPMFTLPEMRGKNLGVYVTNDLVGKLLDRNIKPYFLIVIGNASSEKLSKKVGFTPNGVSVGWCHK